MTQLDKNRLIKARARTANKQKLLSLKKALQQLRKSASECNSTNAGRVVG